jgi:very-short-patch-repair endonuclease
MTRISAALLRKRGVKAPMSDLEIAFARALRLHGRDIPHAVRELRFAPPRRWRFDWAWPAALVAVEIDGGQWAANGGRHNSDKDREKLNAAAALGWRVLRFSGAMLTTDPVGCVDVLRAALTREASVIVTSVEEALKAMGAR